MKNQEIDLEVNIIVTDDTINIEDLIDLKIYETGMGSKIEIDIEVNILVTDETINLEN